jgi:hypothetical protein
MWIVLVRLQMLKRTCVTGQYRQLLEECLFVGVHMTVKLTYDRPRLRSLEGYEVSLLKAQGQHTDSRE